MEHHADPPVDPGVTSEALTIVRLDASTRALFAALHCDANGLGWCHCVAWWVAGFEGWGERTAEDNRALRERLLARGEDDGYLLVHGPEDAHVPVAWAQVAPRDRLGRIAQVFGRAPEPGCWALGCLAVAPAWRGRGCARRLLAGVLADLPARGATALEAYPKSVAALGGPAAAARAEAAEVWTGPLALFAELGFEVVAEVPPRVVVRRALAPVG